MSQIISLSSIDFSYPSGKELILNSVSISLGSGEVIKVGGRNGAGKSTLLKIISGILIPTGGQIIRKPNSKIVYLDQYSNNFTAGSLTVAEHLKLYWSEDPSGNYTDDDIYQILISYGVGLEYMLNSFVDELSGGQRQIVALLSSIAEDADILCLDEFTSALDEESIRNTVSILNHEIEENALAVAYVSHQRSYFDNETNYQLK